MCRAVRTIHALGAKHASAGGLPAGFRHTLSSVVLDEGDSQMLLGLMRERQRGAFDDVQIARVQLALGRAQAPWCLADARAKWPDILALRPLVVR